MSAITLPDLQDIRARRVRDGLGSSTTGSARFSLRRGRFTRRPLTRPCLPAGHGHLQATNQEGQWCCEGVRVICISGISMEARRRCTAPLAAVPPAVAPRRHGGCKAVAGAASFAWEARWPHTLLLASMINRSCSAHPPLKGGAACRQNASSATTAAAAATPAHPSRSMLLALTAPPPASPPLWCAFLDPWHRRSSSKDPPPPQLLSINSRRRPAQRPVWRPSPWEAS